MLLLIYSIIDPDTGRRSVTLEDYLKLNLFAIGVPCEIIDIRKNMEEMQRYIETALYSILTPFDDNLIRFASDCSLGAGTIP
jgi:hypothetical protein